MSPPLVRRLPLAPLSAAVALGDRTRHVASRPDAIDLRGRQCAVSVAATIAELVGVSRRTVVRWRRNGIDVWNADKAACALGLHPWGIWGDEWLQLQLHELLDAEEAV